MDEDMSPRSSLGVCFFAHETVDGGGFSMVGLDAMRGLVLGGLVVGRVAGECFRRDMIGMRLPRLGLRPLTWLLDGAHS